MWWEPVLVAAAVAGSALYLARSALRRLKGRKSCGTGCGSCPGRPRSR